MPLIRPSLVRSSAVALLWAVAACNCEGSSFRNSVPVLAATPDPLDFGTLFVGKTATLALTVRNDGTAPLTLASIELADDARHAFLLEEGAPSALAGGTSAEIHVRYTAPAPDGADSAHLVLKSNDADHPEHVVALVGRSTSVCPGGTSETACGDGKDDDCDGQIDCADPDCAQAPACKPVSECPPNAGELRVSNTPADSGMPLLVWNGSEFAAMWADSSAGTSQDYYFARLSNAAAPVSGPTRVTTTGSIAHWPSFVWTGSEYGVGWSDIRNGPNDIYFLRLSATGQRIGDDVQIFGDDGLSFPGSIAWNARDQEYALTWGQTPPGNQQVRELTFVRASAQGVVRGSPVTETNVGSNTEYPQLVWTGSYYGAVWSDTHEGVSRIYYRRIDANGLSQQQETGVSTLGIGAWNSSVVWNGEGFGVAWTEVRDGAIQVAFARLDAQGKLVGQPTVLGEGGRPSIAWNGSGWAVAYSSKRGGELEQVYVSRLNDAGGRLGTEQRATCQVASGSMPSIAWSGSDYGLVWADKRDGNLEIYFKRLAATP